MKGLICGDTQRLERYLGPEGARSRLEGYVFEELRIKYEGQDTEGRDLILWTEDFGQAEEFLTEQQPELIVCCMRLEFMREGKLLKTIREMQLYENVVLVTPEVNDRYMYLAERVGCGYLFLYEGSPAEYLLFAMRIIVRRAYEARWEQAMVRRGIQWSDMLDFLQHTFYRNVLLSDPWFDEKEQLQKGRDMGLELSIEDRYVVVVLKLHQNKGVTEQGAEAAEDFVENSKLIMGIRQEYHVIEVGNGETALLIQVSNENECEYIGNIMSLFIDYQAIYYDCRWSAYMSDICSLNGARAEYQKLHDVLEKNVAQQCRLFLLHEVAENRELNIIQGKDWIWSFASGNTGPIREEIRQFLEKQLANGIFSRENLQSIVHRLTMSFYASMEMRKLDVDAILADKWYLEHYTMANQSIEGLYRFLEYVSDYNLHLLEQHPPGKGISKNIIRYIRENIDKELTRESIAGQFYMSKGYLANVFKKETRKSLVDYINEEKINKAKELLVMTPMPVSVVAQEVGINNFSYFSRLFKKLAGVSPQNYRNGRQKK